MPEAGAVGVVLVRSRARKGMLQPEGSDLQVLPDEQARSVRSSKAAAPGQAGRGLCPGRRGVRPPGEGRSHEGSNPLLPEAARPPLLPFSPGISADKRLPKRAEARWFGHGRAVRLGVFRESEVSCRGAFGAVAGDGAGRLCRSAILNLVEGERQPRFWGEAAPRATWVWIQRGGTVVMCLV